MIRDFRILTIVLLYQHAARVTPQAAPRPPSPCPDVFQYEREGGRWQGRIEARAEAPPPSADRVVLSLSMTLSAGLPDKFVGSVEPVENRNLILDQMRMGWPVIYRVTFPLMSPLPSVVKIVFNGEVVCTGPGSSGRFVTAIHLEHTLKVEKRNMALVKDDLIVFDGPVRERGIKTDNTEMPMEIRGPVDYSGSDIEFKPMSPITAESQLFHRPIAECGVQASSANANPLIANGQVANRGDWPWLVAMFVKKPRGLDFICAGSLISDRLVLTAAHCVIHREPSEIILKLGVYNLQDWTDEKAATRAVSDIRIHPNAERGVVLKTDIAVLVLQQSIIFSDVIKPVCLWDRDDSQARIIGRSGTVIGWGRDESGVRTTLEPKVANVPIVSTEVCRASRKEFLQITTLRTFCAGARDGSGPCNGDSGGGLYLRDGDKWFIRGIISNSLKDPDTNSCNLYEFIVYTDAAKYSTWIKTLKL